METSQDYSVIITDYQLYKEELIDNDDKTVRKDEIAMIDETGMIDETDMIDETAMIDETQSNFKTDNLDTGAETTESKHTETKDVKFKSRKNKENKKMQDNKILYEAKYHSLRSQEDYANLYGPQFIAKVKDEVAKEKRRKKRPINTSGQSVCCFCPAIRDKLLFVHLKTNADCTKKYMSLYKCQDEDGLRGKITKEKAKLRKRNQRAKLEQKEK